jgi:DNA recombination protein RmuC
MEDVMSNLIVAVIISVLSGAAILFLFMKTRERGIRETVKSSFAGDIRVLQQAKDAAAAEADRLRNSGESLQEKLSVSLIKAAEFEGRFLSAEKRIEELKGELNALKAKLTEKDGVILENMGLIKETGARLEEERRQSEEKLRLVTEAGALLKKEFENLANAIMDEKSKKFTEQNRINMDLVLNPLREQIGEFRKRVDDVYASESKDREALSEHIKILSELNQKVSREADNLTRALKGENKTQGNWGEMVLERALELSGLKKGVEYDAQVSTVNDEGSRMQPDVVIHLPEGRDIVIDSKVALVAYERAVGAETEEERTAQLGQHVKAIAGHIDGLSAKSYENLPELRSLDYVLMFLPIEAAFVAAITEDPGIFEYAYKKRVILVSPSTLMVTLRTIQNMWQSEYQNRNAQEIAKKAADLYDKFAGFVENLGEIKKAVGLAARQCDEAEKKLCAGKGNIIKRIEDFKMLGVRPKKCLPPGLVEKAEEEDGAINEKEIAEV